MYKTTIIIISFLMTLSVKVLAENITILEDDNATTTKEKECIVDVESTNPQECFAKNEEATLDRKSKSPAKAIDNSKDKSQTKEEDKSADEKLSEIMQLTEDDIIMGNNSAKVVVFEYSSPTCPHCSQYRSGLFAKIIEKYIDKGLITYVIREFVGNKQDLDASILINCAPKEKAYKFLEIIYKQQNNWAYNINYRENLANIGKIGGLSKDEYTNCLNDNNLIQKVISITRKISKIPSFVGTPTFFIRNKDSIVNVPAHKIMTTLDEMLLE